MLKDNDLRLLRLKLLFSDFDRKFLPNGLCSKIKSETIFSYQRFSKHNF